MRLTKDDLENILNTADAATLGPWYAHHTDDPLFMNCHTVTTKKEEPETEGPNERLPEVICGTLVQSVLTIGHEAGRWEQDARFIAMSREVVPLLVREVEILTAERDEAEGLLSDAAIDGGFRAGQASERKRIADIITSDLNLDRWAILYAITGPDPTANITMQELPMSRLRQEIQRFREAMTYCLKCQNINSIHAVIETELEREIDAYQ